MKFIQFCTIRNIFLLYLFGLSNMFAVAQDMQSEIESDYQKVYQATIYGFIGDQLHAIRIADDKSISDFENVEKNSPHTAATNLLLHNVSSFHNVTSIDCLTARLSTCLVIHGGDDGLMQNVSILVSSGKKNSRIDLPVKVGILQYSFGAKTDKGWIISSFDSGKVFSVARTGHYAELPEFTFDPKEDFLEIRQAWAGKHPVAIGILVQKNTLLGDHHEEKWSVIEAGASSYSVDAPEGCLYLGYSDHTFACSWYDDQGNSNVRYLRAGKGKALTPTANHNLGQVSLSGPDAGPAQNYRGGFLINMEKNGHKALYYLPVGNGRKGFAEKLNGELEYLRGNGDLTFEYFSSVGNRLILTQQSSIRPYKTLLVPPGKTPESGNSDSSVLGKAQILSTGVSYFNPDNMTAERFISKDRQVPYTVISQPGSQGKAQGKAILNIYGSYGILLQESYLKEFGKFWIQEGGVYVYVHARGGGGFGRKWRKAGYGTKKIETVYDLEDVARDLVARGYAKMGQVNLQAGSAGGIVAASAALRRPDIFSRIALTSPCLGLWDNQRGYCTLDDEFGNPLVPGDMTLMHSYSPVHLLWSAQKVIPFLIIQSSRDPVVPPVVTDAFLNMKKNTDFARIIQIDGTVHGEDFSYQDRAYVAAERLKFFLGEDIKGRMNHD